MAHVAISRDISNNLPDNQVYIKVPVESSDRTSSNETALSADQTSSDETGLEPQERVSLSSEILYWVSDILGILWLGPALALLILNFKGHIIGSSLGCRGAGCHFDRFAADQVTRAQAMDKRDHDILGALQLVAKVLEAWFMFVATSLAYNVTLHLASRKEKLPIGLLMKHLEFKEIMFVFGLVTKKNIKPVPNGVTSRSSRYQRHVLLYTFMTLLVCLSTLANLMGPAAAVLAIPTLQWIDREWQNELIFNDMSSSTPPRDDSIVPLYCNATILASGNFSCTENVYAPSLDGLITNNQATDRQWFYLNGTFLPPVSQELEVSFSVNLTGNSNTQWVPNRSVLRNLSEDYKLYINLTVLESFKEPPALQGYSVLNSSLQARLQRDGPVVGVDTQCYNLNLTIIPISQDKTIRCYYSHVRTTNDTSQTSTAKCIPWGSSWNAAHITQAYANFLVEDFSINQDNLPVQIFMTDRVAYIDSNTKPGCFTNGLINDNGTCDWNEIFSDNCNSPELGNTCVSQQTFEYYVPSLANSAINRNLTFFRWCHTSYTLGFATYILNPSSINNLLNLVEIDISNEAVRPLEVHPDWILAAWAVDRNGSVHKSRLAATALISSFVKATNYTVSYPQAVPLYLLDFTGVHRSALIQAASMMTYSFIDAATVFSVPTDRKQHPRLKVWVSGQLWKFGLGSRSSKFGAAVMIAGCVIVLLRTIFHRWDVPSPVELIVEALRYENGGEFDNVPPNARGSVRFQLGQKGGHFSYKLEEHQSLRLRKWRWRSSQ
jgi:hypothetical protein